MENNDSNIVTTDDESAGSQPQVNPTLVVWGIISLAFAILACVVNTSPLVLRAGFFAKTFAVLVGAVLGLVGASIGDALRKFAHPDAVFTNGGFFQLIWIKVFWKIGPQVIGMVIGVLIGIGVVLK